MKVNFEKIIIPSSKDNIRNLLTKFIQCKICMNLLNDPHDCLCCNQTFCKSCIINYIKANKKCPFSDFFESKNNNNKDINDLVKRIKPSSSNFSKVIQSLKFYCQNKERGCNNELNIEEILEHEKICKFNNKNIKAKENSKIEKYKEKINNENIKKNHNNIEDMNKNRKNIDKSQNDIFKNKERKNSDIISRNSNRKNTISSNTNQLKQQDSVISFCDIKNYLDDKNNPTNFSSNIIENDKNEKNSTLKKLNIEKYMEEINQKLSLLNKYIINSNALKLNNENYYKLNNLDNNIEKEISEFNIKYDYENKKENKNNSIPINNNYYEDSYVNSINFSEQQTNKTDYLDSIKNETKNIQKNNIISLNVKQSNKTIDISNKNNKFQKYLKHKKILNQKILKKNSNKKVKTKNLKLFTEFNTTINKTKILNQTKTENFFGRNSIHFTPKLGSKSKKTIKEDKSFKMNTEINNSIYFQNECHTVIEDIFISIKNLENKINSVEKLLQSNTCIKNQEYSIQKNDVIEKISHNTNNRENLIDEKNMKCINELMNQKEENFKNILNEKMESFKKYITEQCIAEMKKSILDTNMDIMKLYHDKLDEFEKVINKNYKSKNSKASK